MVVPRQGRREPQCFSALGQLRTRPRGEQRGPAAQTVFRQTLLEPVDPLDLEDDPERGDRSDHDPDRARVAHVDRAQRTPGDEVAPAREGGSVDEREAVVGVHRRELSSAAAGLSPAGGSLSLRIRLRNPILRRSVSNARQACTSAATRAAWSNAHQADELIAGIRSGQACCPEATKRWYRCYCVSSPLMPQVSERRYPSGNGSSGSTSTCVMPVTHALPRIAGTIAARSPPRVSST